MDFTSDVINVVETTEDNTGKVKYVDLIKENPIECKYGDVYYDKAAQICKRGSRFTWKEVKKMNIIENLQYTIIEKNSYE